MYTPGGRSNHSVSLMLAVLAATSINSFATDVLQADPESSRWNIAPHVDYLQETGEALTVEGLRQSPVAEEFKPLDADSVNFGIIKATYWFRFTVANQRTHRAEFYVELDNPRIKRADFYVPGASGPEAHQWSGTIMPFNERSMPYRHAVFRLTLEPDEEQTVYCRIYKRGSYRFNLSLWEKHAFVQKHTLGIWLDGSFYGALVIMLVFNFILFALFRDRSFFFLSATIAFTALYMMAYQRIDEQFIWPNGPSLPGSRLNVITGLGLCSLVLFSRDLLGTPKNAPRWDRVYRLYAVLSLLVCVDIFVDAIWTEWLLQIVGGTAPIILVVGAVISIRQGNRYAWGYLIAWVFLFSTMVPFALLGVGLIPQSFIVEHGPKVAFPLTLALNSIALWQRFRELQDQHNANLDRQVKERTKELTAALENVKTLHGLIPICSACKSIRDDHGFWTQVETYIHDNSDADFTHSICPKCAKKIYGMTTE